MRTRHVYHLLEKTVKFISTQPEALITLLGINLWRDDMTKALQSEFVGLSGRFV
jgi:hypothetical protein